MISIASAISSIPTSPMWPNRRILPVHLPWPPAMTRPLRAHRGVERSPLDSVGQPCRRDGRRIDPRGGDEPQAERFHAGATPAAIAACRVATSARGPPRAAAGRRPAARRARRSPASTASVPSSPSPAPRRSPSRSAACVPSRLRPSARSPTAAIAMPGDAIHAFWLALTTRSTPQRVHLEWHRAQPADAVDEEKRLAGRTSAPPPPARASGWRRRSRSRCA